MKRFVALVISAALVAPSAALAQETHAADAGFGIFTVHGPPSPELRSKMDAARKAAHADALATLHPDHRAKAEAILSKLRDGSISPERASVQLEDLLTPEETTALAAQERRFHETMRRIMEESAPRAHRGPGDAARYLLMLSGPPMMALPPLPPPR